MIDWELRLLGCWQLLGNGAPAVVGSRQQRLITALALMGPRPRAYLAGLLWPESAEQQAAGSLRATVFKVRHQLPGLLSDTLEPVSLAPRVAVDIRKLRERAELARSSGHVDRGLDELLYIAELLPGWYEDWVIFEQERLRALRVSTLEALAWQYLDRDEPDLALAAARQAARIEPLRESAHVLIVRAQIQAGNTAAAHRTVEEFRRRLRDELGLEPSARLRAAAGGGSGDLLGLPAPVLAHQHPRYASHRQLTKEL
jgi:DNA-binding SARP family transcriptional activator